MNKTAINNDELVIFIATIANFIDRISLIWHKSYYLFKIATWVEMLLRFYPVVDLGGGGAYPFLADGLQTFCIYQARQKTPFCGLFFENTCFFL